MVFFVFFFFFLMIRRPQRSTQSRSSAASDVYKRQTHAGAHARFTTNPRLRGAAVADLSLIHISEPTRLGMISYAVFCWKKKKPQLFNVLRGEMSLIGPRPERPIFVDELAKVIQFYNHRGYVKPGLIGWAQVNFPYGASVDDAR